VPTRSLFLFRRAYRLSDNTGLQAACDASDTVIPAFVFDPRQCDPAQNSFFSEHAFTFLVRSLKELDTALRERDGRLYALEGAPTDQVRTLLRDDDLDAVYVNRDYTPFARRRDEALREVCAAFGAEFHRYNTHLLTEPEDVQPQSGGAYHVYSPFRRHAQSYTVPRPTGPAEGAFFDGALSVDTVSLDAYDRYSADDLRVSGGRDEGLQLLDGIQVLTDYRSARHEPAQEALTALSAHHKFGTVSIRETYWAVEDAFEDYHKLTSQLYWRDFYTHLLFHRPQNLNVPLQAKGRHLDWRNDRADFDRWCAGQTGVPFVDAGMRELNATGYMHNRARMTVASFLTKDLLTSWRWGAQYFARTLTDYDPAVNAGNWQWAASVGTDYKLRIYNPYSQAQKHDPSAAYIQRWVPELADVDPDHLTSGDPVDFSAVAAADEAYPAPIVDRNAAYHRARDAFAAAKEAAE
jgi:deoxyribodipyrimidine photo-lyase